MLDFQKIKKSLGQKKEYFLNDVLDFFLFCITAIIGTLLFYRQTQDEFTAMLILSTLWVFFWKESDMLGRVFLVSASLIGYVHELLGVQAGYFTYLGGFFGGVPIWILPGYGAIFWASYHFWSIFEKTYILGSAGGKFWELVRRVFSHERAVILAASAALFALDIFFFGFLQKPVLFSIEFFLVAMLWKSLKDVRLAYFVAFFTVFDEFAGEAIGTWSHPVFSLVSLATGYMFLLWMATAITDMLQKKKVWMPREMAGAVIFFAVFTINTYLRLTGLGGF